MYSQHGTIERCTLPERKIIFSSPISGEYDEDDFSIAAEFSLRLKKLFHLYDNFGSCISIEDIQKNSFNSYHSFFAYCPQTSDVYDESCLPEHICALFASVTGENFPKSTARSFIMPANTI